MSVCLLGLAVVYQHPPGTDGFYPPCPFHWLTDLNCPGCGTLRALHALMHGHVSRALAFNPLSMTLLPVVAILLCHETASFVRGTRSDTERWSTARIPAQAIWGLFFLIVAFWILRNIPVYPFTLLGPG